MARMNQDIWHKLDDGNGINGMEAFVGDSLALDVLSYRSGEYSWMLREWTADNRCVVTASYDSDEYYSTADKALAALVEHLRARRPDVLSLVESHPIRDSLVEFGRKALSFGFAITLTLFAGIGAAAVQPQEAHAGILSTIAIVNILSDSDEGVSAESIMMSDEVLDTLAVTYDDDVVSDVIGAPAGVDSGGGYAYLIGDADDAVTGRFVALSFDSGVRAVIDNPELWNAVHQVLDANGAQAVEFDSLVCHLSGVSSDWDPAPVPDEVKNIVLTGLGGAIVIVSIAGVVAYCVWRQRDKRVSFSY